MRGEEEIREKLRAFESRLKWLREKQKELGISRFEAEVYVGSALWIEEELLLEKIRLLKWVLGEDKKDMGDGKIEAHLDPCNVLKYRKKRGEWIQVYCMFREIDPSHKLEWLDIEKISEGLIRIQSVNSIVVPIKPFIGLLQEFAKEMEAEKDD